MMRNSNEVNADSAGETIADALKQAVIRLRTGGVDSPEHDARLLMQAAVGMAHAGIIAHGDRLLDQKELGQFHAFIARRVNREPVFRIIGQKEFWGLELDIPSSVLEPRADTECLVEAVLNWVDLRGTRQADLRIADIGTGSGAIIIALLSELPNSSGIAIDISVPALEVARANARKHQLDGRIVFLSGSYCQPLACNPLSGMFDLIVSNPPYISSSSIGQLSSEVRNYDPGTALDGGADGLDAYRELLRESSRYLRSPGSVFFEIGYDQADDVKKIAEGQGWKNINILRDLNGNDRVLGALL